MTTAQATIDEKQGDRLQELGRDLARQGRRVYLAGLGAVGAVGEMGYKATNELIERGRKLEKEERPILRERLQAGRERVERFGREAEHRFEERMTATMERFGVPSRDDVRTLIERIEKLTEKVESLSARG